MDRGCLIDDPSRPNAVDNLLRTGTLDKPLALTNDGHLERVPNPLDAVLALLLEPLLDDLARSLVEVPGREEDVGEFERAFGPGAEESDGEQLTKRSSRQGEKREGQRDG